MPVSKINAIRQLVLILCSQLANTPVARQSLVCSCGRPVRRQNTREVMAVGDSAAPQPPNRLRPAETHTRLWRYTQGTISKNKTEIIYTAHCEIMYTLTCSSLGVEQALNLQKWTISVMKFMCLRVEVLLFFVNDCVSPYHRLV